MFNQCWGARGDTHWNMNEVSDCNEYQIGVGCGRKPGSNITEYKQEKSVLLGQPTNEEEYVTTKSLCQVLHLFGSKAKRFQLGCGRFVEVCFYSSKKEGDIDTWFEF